MAKKAKRQKSAASEAQSPRTMEDVARYIQKMRFKKRIFGGVDEADLWRRLEQLHKQYEFVFLYQQARLAELQDRLNALSERQERSTEVPASLEASIEASGGAKTEAEHGETE